MNKLESIKTLINDSSSRNEKLFSLAIQSLIVLSLITFSIETLPNLSNEAQRILRLIEVVLISIFTVEYIARIYTAENRVKFATSFFGIVDFLSIIPFYLSLGLDLRSLRAFRLFRLVRILKLGRYNKAMNQFGSALKEAKEELILYLCFTCLLLYLTAVGIYFFENLSLIHI